MKAIINGIEGVITTVGDRQFFCPNGDGKLAQPLQATTAASFGVKADQTVGGVKYDECKPDFSLHPPIALEEIAKVWSFGAQKYESFNWAKGFAWRRPVAAALRHIFAWLSGQDVDPESGISHLAHAACNLFMVIHFQATGTGTDNRMEASHDKKG